MEAAGLRSAEIDTMGILEIILIIIGIIVFAASFLIPEKYAVKDEGNLKEQERKIKLFLQRELQNIRKGIEEKVDESMVSSSEKTERYMERITNEKIMAIQEYSDTVLEQIHKNHEEAVFLYDMLNSKHDQIKYTAGEISSSVDKAKEKLELTIQETTRELLRGSIRENLLEKIENMLQETVQEAIDSSIKEELKEQVDYTIEEQLQEAVKSSLMDIIKETVKEAVQDTVGVVHQRGVQENRDIEAVVDRNELREEPIGDESADSIPETIFNEAEKDCLEDVLTEFSFDLPEAYEEEEQPPAVKTVDKVIPQKKMPSKKGYSRNFATLRGQGDIEAQSHFEENRGTGSKDRILQLHREGKSNVVIAKELGIGIGEVKLVIGLFE